MLWNWFPFTGTTEPKLVSAGQCLNVHKISSMCQDWNSRTWMFCHNLSPSQHLWDEIDYQPHPSPSSPASLWRRGFISQLPTTFLGAVGSITVSVHPVTRRLPVRIPRLAKQQAGLHFFMDRLNVSHFIVLHCVLKDQWSLTIGPLDKKKDGDCRSQPDTTNAFVLPLLIFIFLQQARMIMKVRCPHTYGQIVYLAVLFADIKQITEVKMQKYFIEADCFGNIRVTIECLVKNLRSLSIS